MKKKILFAGILSFMALTLTFVKTPITTSASELTVETIEALADDDEKQCQGPHLNGCHAGGLLATSCSIDASFHACIGGLGGGCSISCNSAGYACCGFECKCIPINGSNTTNS